MSVLEVFLVRNLPHLDWIQRFTSPYSARMRESTDSKKYEYGLQIVQCIAKKDEFFYTNTFLNYFLSSSEICRLQSPLGLMSHFSEVSSRDQTINCNDTVLSISCLVINKSTKVIFWVCSKFTVSADTRPTSFF